MTQDQIKQAIARLSREIVRCDDQAACDRMEMQLAGLYSALEPDEAILAIRCPTR